MVGQPRRCKHIEFAELKSAGGTEVMARLVSRVSKEKELQPGGYFVHLRLFNDRCGLRNRGGGCGRSRSRGGFLLFELFHFGFEFADTVHQLLRSLVRVGGRVLCLSYSSAHKAKGQPDG